MGAQLGYRYSPGTKHLSVHALPLTAQVGWEVGDAVRAALGLSASGELKIPVTQDRSKVAWGAEAGPYALARVPSATGYDIVVVFAVGWRLARVAYLHDHGQIKEHHWVTTVAVGTEWP